MNEQPWEPFERAYIPQEQLDQLKITEPPLMFRNNRYQVALRKLAHNLNVPVLIHLSIKRIDKEPIHDWRDLQRIKNELIGTECEAVELYPAESRLVDDANQFHLWAIADPGFRFPFGFNERLVSEGSALGSKQRDFPADAKPPDLRTITDESELGRTMKELRP